MKLTYASFWAHVKIAYRIISFREFSWESVVITSTTTTTTTTPTTRLLPVLIPWWIWALLLVLSYISLSTFYMCPAVAHPTYTHTTNNDWSLQLLLYTTEVGILLLSGPVFQRYFGQSDVCFPNQKSWGYITGADFIGRMPFCRPTNTVCHGQQNSQTRPACR